MDRTVLGIVGSYRRDGTIDRAVAAVLAGAREEGAEIRTVYLTEWEIAFCTNCRRCTQQPGAAPGRCIHDDDMPGLIARIEAADALVLGAPVNVGAVNALTQRFLERLVCYSDWPWGQPAPKLRKAGQPPKPAVLVTSSAMPALLGRLTTGALHTLKLGAKMVRARPVATLFVGLAARCEHQELAPRILRRARRAGRRLVSRAAA